MDPRLLTYYNRELHHLRETSGEFAAEFPKIAGRLSLDSFECADPYVERLLEGFAFMAARVQLKIDAEFPKFTQHMLQMIYPHYLAPTPSMAVVQLNPDLEEGSLAEGFTVERHSPLRSLIGKGEQTACTFRTAHDVALWPIQIVEAEYFTRDMASVQIPNVPGVKAGFRIKLRSTAGLNFNELSLETLRMYLRGGNEQSSHIYEQLMANALAVVVRSPANDSQWEEILPSQSIGRVGFSDNQSLLPYGTRSFQGYRLLEEYFALPQRFLFVDFNDLGRAVRRCESNELELLVLVDRHDHYLDNQVDDNDFALFCSPISNVFPKRADRIHLNERKPEYQVIADRTRPLDFEIYDVLSATGFGTGVVKEQPFSPFYTMRDAEHAASQAYFVLNRRQRKVSTRQQQRGPRSSYLGSEAFISLVDQEERPYQPELRQLGMDTLCTNRDLPLYMPVGIGDSDFSVQDNAPVKSVLCLAGPTKPRGSRAGEDGGTAWRLVNHLSLNYLSLLDNDERQGAAALRSLLELYGDASEAAIRKQIDGVRGITSKPVTRPIRSNGPLTFGRGLEVTVNLDESAFEGTGMFLLGAVLDDFFAKYVSLNSFTETVVTSIDRGEVVRWPARIGRRELV